MTERRGHGQRQAIGVLMVVGLLWAPAAVAQTQGAFGAGPLTSGLIDTEPTTGALTWRNLKMAPGLVIDELGQDDNVFDQRDDPKTDYVFRGTPDLSLFSRVRFAQVSLYAGAPLAYYRTYADERAVGSNFRGRLDGLIGLLRPFVAGGRIRERTRPNGEIDVRADQTQEELSGGLGYEMSAYSMIYVAAHRHRVSFRESREEGVDLSAVLNRESVNYSAGVRTALTPLANLTVSGGFQEDRFKLSPLRNADLWNGNMSLQIGAEAALTGVVSVGYTNVKAYDPLIDPYRGVTSAVAITYSFLEMARVSGTLIRGFQYSFLEDEAYYKETTAMLSYTHRLFGEIDFRVEGSKSLFDYGFREGTPPRQDELDSVGASIGYNLRNRTRVAVNYDRSRRRSPAFSERNYDRDRIYLSWAFAY